MERVQAIRQSLHSGYGKYVAGLIALASIVFAIYHGRAGNQVITLDSGRAFLVVAVLTVIAGLVLVADAIRMRSYAAAFFGLVQVTGLIYFDYYVGKDLEVTGTLALDWFSVIFVLLTGVMGAILCWRTKGGIWQILSILAVDGLALSDDLLWMFLFWTVLTGSSFHLILSDRKSAAECARRMLALNIYAGLSFLAGIAVSGMIFETVNITTLRLFDTVYADMTAVCAIFIVLAGIARAMQMPFRGWFLHEYKMSAGAASVIQSLTFVSSGAILVIKMSPAMGISNFAGLMAIIVGGVTFFIASFNAITASNTRKMLADSTSATMGLVVLCAGVGTSESVWAAVMLVIFHSVAKPLLLAGTESDHLRTDTVMAVIVMMAAPFAVVLLQRQTLGSIVDTGNVILVMILCFSGAIAIFYWTRWLGSMIARAADEGIEPLVFAEMNSFKANAWFLIIITLGMPFLSLYMVVPYMEEIFGGMSSAANLTDNIMDSVVIAAAVALAAYPIYKGRPPREKRADRIRIEAGVRAHELLRRSRTTVKVQILCSIVSIGIIVLCLGFVFVNLYGLLGGVL